MKVTNRVSSSSDSPDLEDSPIQLSASKLSMPYLCSKRNFDKFAQNPLKSTGTWEQEGCSWRRIQTVFSAQLLDNTVVGKLDWI